MFDVGFSEFFLIFVILLLVVGPNRLPGIARTAGRWIGKARSIMATVKSEVEQELKVDELKRSIKEETPVDDFKSFADEFKSMQSEVSSIGDKAKSSLEESTTETTETATAATHSASPTSTTKIDSKPASGINSISAGAASANAINNAKTEQIADAESDTSDQLETLAESSNSKEVTDSSKVSTG